MKAFISPAWWTWDWCYLPINWMLHSLPLYLDLRIIWSFCLSIVTWNPKKFRINLFCSFTPFQLESGFSVPKQKLDTNDWRRARKFSSEPDSIVGTAWWVTKIRTSHQHWHYSGLHLSRIRMLWTPIISIQTPPVWTIFSEKLKQLHIYFVCVFSQPIPSSSNETYQASAHAIYFLIKTIQPGSNYRMSFFHCLKNQAWAIPTFIYSLRTQLQGYFALQWIKFEGQYA